VELLNFLNIDRAHICGISLGGMTALWLAINAPDRVNRIMPCNTAARLGTVEMWNTRIETIRAGGMASIADATMERWFSPAYRAKNKAQVATTRQIFLQTHAPGYMSCCAALRDADLSAKVGSIKAPTLAIAGACDPVTPPSDLMWLQENIPGAKYLELKAAHLSNLEQPDAFFDAMLSFLGEKPH
jgi:3-oxoadipate enol-lactonase